METNEQNQLTTQSLIGLCYKLSKEQKDAGNNDLAACFDFIQNDLLQLVGYRMAFDGIIRNLDKWCEENKGDNSAVYLALTSKAMKELRGDIVNGSNEKEARHD